MPLRPTMANGAGLQSKTLASKRLPSFMATYRLQRSMATLVVGGFLTYIASSIDIIGLELNVGLTSSLKSRHIQFIALGGTIGTGLFLGIGRAFVQAGPLSVLLGYTFTGIAVFAMVGYST
jgi:amino acid permease